MSKLPTPRWTAHDALLRGSSGTAICPRLGETAMEHTHVCDLTTEAIERRDAAVRLAALEEAAHVADGYQAGCEETLRDVQLSGDERREYIAQATVNTAKDIGEEIRALGASPAVPPLTVSEEDEGMVQVLSCTLARAYLSGPWATPQWTELARAALKALREYQAGRKRP